MKAKNIVAFFIYLSFCTFGPAWGAERKIAQESKVLVEDVVYKVVSKGIDYKVMFQKHAGVYYLKSSSKHFKAIKSALEESINTGDSVQIKADATSLEIEELLLSAR